MHNQREHRSPRRWSSQHSLITVLISFIVLSLMLHALTIYNLLRVRQIVSKQLDVSANQVAQLRQQRVEYKFPVQQTFPVSTTITINEKIAVPINFQVPIKQMVRVPINTPLGSVPLEVPLNLTVPISNTVMVPINKQIPFHTTVPINTEVPIQLPLGQGEAGNVLQQLEDGLRDLRRQLSQ